METAFIDPEGTNSLIRGLKPNMRSYSSICLRYPSSEPSSMSAMSVPVIPHDISVMPLTPGTSTPRRTSQSTSGEVSILPNIRMSVLKQNQNAYDAYNVMDTVIMGNQRLYDIGKEKEALYAKEEMTDEDGMLACQLEEEYAELGGWEAESDASRILQGLGIGTDLHYNDMATLDARLKVKVLLAQALFGNPDLLMMDEPTNNLDIDAVNWLEDFLLDFEGTVIVVSHDRHFLNTVCTHIVDIDYNKIKMYVGNYDFWYESSATRRRSRSCRTSSPASPPTSPSPSRPPPAGSCWTSSPWRRCPPPPAATPGWASPPTGRWARTSSLSPT